SLYATFGDKETLFLRALEHYDATCLRPVLRVLGHAGGTQSRLEGMLAVYRELLTSPSRPRGCLLGRMAAEKGSDPGVIGRTLRQRLLDWEGAIYETLRRGQRQGEIPLQEDSRSLARWLLAVIQGMSITANVQDDPGALLDISRVALGRLEIPLTSPSAGPTIGP
ncbi:MAG: TetR family transcriptional regulator C-terminal domain-containing protein, partial [Acidobacteria bacterium]|nr:TetR family transcriptional regulator C-terminal domain-containing protein [Acidobacteriota bacterium]